MRPSSLARSCLGSSGGRSRSSSSRESLSLLLGESGPSLVGSRLLTGGRLSLAAGAPPNRRAGRRSARPRPRPRRSFRRAFRSSLMYCRVWAQTLDEVLTTSLPAFSCTGRALAATSAPTISGHTAARARAGSSPGAVRVDRAAPERCSPFGAGYPAGPAIAAASQTSPSRSPTRSKSSGAGHRLRSPWANSTTVARVKLLL